MTDNIPSVSELENWLVERVATYEEIAPETFTVLTPLAELGFNSVYAMTLCGEIEDEYGLDADPAIVWDNPNIHLLAQALGTALASN